MSTARTNALSRQAISTNHGADSPTTDRATPTTKNAAMPNSASASAVAFETDMNDRSAVVDKTTRICRFDRNVRVSDLMSYLTLSHESTAAEASPSPKTHSSQ